MLKLRVDTKPATNPHLVRLADLDSRMVLHERSLDFQFFGKPKIVGVEKREIAPARDRHSPVSCCRYAFLWLPDQTQMRSELREFLGCAIR